MCVLFVLCSGRKGGGGYPWPVCLLLVSTFSSFFTASQIQFRRQTIPAKELKTKNFVLKRCLGSYINFTNFVAIAAPLGTGCTQRLTTCLYLSRAARTASIRHGFFSSPVLHVLPLSGTCSCRPRKKGQKAPQEAVSAALTLVGVYNWPEPPPPPPSQNFDFVVKHGE